MSGVIGGLEMQMLLDMARWQADVTNAGRVLDRGLGEMKKMTTNALGAVVAGLSVGAFTAWIKGAIDAGDEAFNLSKKTGIAAQDLAGLQLAFKQAGVDSGGMQTAMVKLSKNVAEGNEVFRRLGINVRSADGDLKSSKQVLYDVADVFADMPDGINKTALATEVFGKAGADLLPMLGEGSEGLRDMAEMAEKLGLVIDDETAAAADGFNDTVELLGLASQGAARQVSAQLLPTLKDLAGTMLENVTSGDSLRRGSEILASGLKLLFSTALYGAEIFNSLGKTAGAVAAVVVAVAKGEFDQAREIWRAADADIQASNRQTQKTVDDLWSGSAAVAVDQANKLTKGTRATAIATKEQADVAKKAAEEQEKLTKAGQDYLLQLNREYAELQRSITLGRELTDGEKKLLQLEEQLARGKLVLTDAERRSAEAKLREIDATREQRRQADEYAKLLVAVAQHSSKWADEQAKTTEGLRSGNVSLIEQNEKLRIGEAAWAAREVAVLMNQAADLEWQAANEGGNFQLEEQARLLRDRATLLQDGTVLREAKAAADEWQKTADSIGKGLTDSLFRAFEAGRGFFSTLWEGIKNLFKTTVLQLAIKPVQQAINGVVGSLLGTGGTGGGSGLGGLYQAGSSLYNMGSAAYSWLTTGSSVGTTATNAALIESAAGSAGYGASSASSAGAAGAAGSAMAWAAFAALVANQASKDYESGHNAQMSRDALRNATGTSFAGREWEAYKLLSKLGVNDKWASILSGSTAVAKAANMLGLVETHHRGSVVGIAADGTAATRMQDDSQITRNYSDNVDQALRGLGGTSTTLLNSLSKSFGGTGGFGALLKFAVDGKDPSIGQAFLTRGGQQVGYVGSGSDFARYSKDGSAAYQAFAQDVARATRSAIDAIGLPNWARETFAQLADDSTMDDLARVIAQVSEFQLALLSVQESVSPLGGVFARVAGLSGDALKQLTDFAGGIEAFGQKVGSYVSNYYSADEQAALNAAALQRQLASAGIDGGALTDRSSFRAMLDGVDVGNEAGRRQLAALLDAQAAFAPLADYISENGGTLASLASLAPSLGALGDLNAASADAATAASSTALLVSANTYLTSIADSTQLSAANLQALIVQQSAAAQAVLERLDRLSDGLAESFRGQYLLDLAQP